MPSVVWPTSKPPWIMGILNVTPDSFSDGGQFLDPDRAAERARNLIAEGADILDIGGESTRPGSLPVELDEQIRRVIPVMTAVRRIWDGPISVDTTKSVVARAALDEGASWINDISALREDPLMAELVESRKCLIIIMHMLGSPRTMQEKPEYRDVVSEVREFLSERAQFAESSGISHENIILDPGIGFGKTTQHNLALLGRLREIVELGYPTLVGASRKSFIGHLADAPVDDRLAGSLACAIRAADSGAQILRVHDVGPTRQALAVAAAVSVH